MMWGDRGAEGDVVDVVDGVDTLLSTCLVGCVGELAESAVPSGTQEQVTTSVCSSKAGLCGCDLAPSLGKPSSPMAWRKW